MEKQASKPIRLWPLGVVVILQIVTVMLSVTPAIQNSIRFLFMMAGPLLCLLLFLLLLWFTSRLPWRDRLLLPLFMLLLGVLVALVSAPSARLAVWTYGFPLNLLVITVMLWQLRHAQGKKRLHCVVVAMLVTFGLFPVIRIDGFTGSYFPEMAWRWAPQPGPAPAPGVAVADDIEQWHAQSPHWPGFRGPNRDSRAQGYSAKMDWQSSPPHELWRIPMGPAWSSFAYANGRLFTQEQHADIEVISCYQAETGQRLWQHDYAARFTEVVSGPGPRATPTLDGDTLFACGATGMLFALKAANGNLLWKHDLVAEFKGTIPMWGFSCSPLVLEGIVIVYAGGEGDMGLIGFAQDTGEFVWSVPSADMNFSSAQKVGLFGKDYALFANQSGLLAIEPQSGDLLWRFKPTKWKGPPMVQTQQISPTSLVVALGDGVGVTRLEVTLQAEQWQVSEQWSSRAIRPSFNDYVFHEGFLYGFDQNRFTCASAATGKRAWRGGRYGFGQVLLLARTGQLVVSAENGDLVLLGANPEKHQELGRIPMLNGKTWNHPVLANQRLFVRNGEQAVCLSF